MDKMLGVQFSQVWNNMQLVDKMKLRLDVARFQSTWLSVGFSEFGGIYYAQDQANLKPEKHLYGGNSGRKNLGYLVMISGDGI